MFINLLLAASFVAQAAAPAADAIVPAKKFSLFNGKDLTGWTPDVPAKDTKPEAPDSFIVRDGMLVSLGTPRGHLLTNDRYRDYRLEVEYRFPGKPGNCGVLVHASRLRALSRMFPQSIEVQMNHTHAGDFWCIEENIEVPDMETRRPRKDGQKYGGSDGDARTSKRNCTADDTLLTFCPPGPDERTKDSDSSESSMEMVSVTRCMVLSFRGAGTCPRARNP